MSVLNYEDVHDYTVNTGYAIPNEQRDRWEKLLGSRPIYKAAAICSGGEVGLLNLLPRVRQELVLIDHSYKSLAVAITKYLALRDLGAEEAYTLFTTCSDVAVFDALSKYRKELPNDKLKQAFKSMSYYAYGSKIKAEWSKTPLNRVKLACTKLDKVKFIHGDLSDLVERGPFGLIYLSNALEHSGRKGGPKIAELKKALRPGGYILTSDAGYGRKKVAGLDIVDGQDGDRNASYQDGKLWWRYQLLRFPKAAPCAA